MRLIQLIICAFLSASLQANAAPGADVEPLRIAVASNFAMPLQRLVDTYTAVTGEKISISSASTGALYNQIIHGAPFDLLLAADSERPARLEAEGLTFGKRDTYALGQLVLAYQPALEDLAASGIEALLASPGLNLAMANPELAPYGQAAQAVLQRFPDAEPRVLTGANVSQAMQMWITGGADAAFVSASFQPAQSLAVPADWHPPIAQQAVVLANSNNIDRAQAFMFWLHSLEARHIIQAQGYKLPEPVDG